MSIDNSVESVETENLSKQLAITEEKLSLANRELSSLRRVKDKVGITFKKYPEAGEAQILRKGYIPYLTRVDNYCVVKDEPQRGEHVLIEGDNISALIALQATHKGRVDVIYIDPPYNTGNNDFIYNDRYVSNDEGFRHSKWLSFMERRLHLAKELLSETGVIFVSIDDNEQASLKMLMDGIFGVKTFIADAIWRSRQSVSNDALISMNHNHTLIYAMNPIDMLRQARQGKVFRLPADESKFANPDNDPKGPWMATPFDAPNIRKNLSYAVVNPNTREIYFPPQGRCWRTTEEEYNRLFSAGEIIFGKNGISKPQQKRYLSQAQISGLTPTTIWADAGTTTDGSRTLKQIFGNIPFTNPKPVELLLFILKLSAKKDALVLDFFAGSGTTGHAVAALNAEDGGNRQAILVTNNFEQDGSPNGIARDVTAARMKAVLTGVWADGKSHDTLPGNLHYYKIDFKKPVTNMMNNAQIMQSRFTGLAALATGVHIVAEADEIHASLTHLREAIQSNQCSLLSSEDSYVVVWKDYDELLDNEKAAQLVLNDVERISEATRKSKVLYVPFDAESVEDEFYFPGWNIISFPVAYIKIINNIVNELINSDLLPELVEVNDEEGIEAIPTVTA